MYRRSLTEKMANETEAQDPQFVQRVSNLPIVTAALDQLVTIYEQTKSSNKMIKYTLETGESVVKTATATAKPVLEKLPLEKPIGALDSLACSQLDKLEGKYPILNKPTDDWKEGTKEIYDANMKPTVDKVVAAKDSVVAAKDTGISSVVAAKDYSVNTVVGAKDYGVSTVAAAKDYSVNKMSEAKQYTVDTVEGVKTYTKETIQGVVHYTTDKVSTALASPTGQVLVENVDSALAKTEGLVDYYLPSDEENDNEGEEGMEVDCVEPTDPLRRVTTLSSKMQRRVLARALRQLQNVQKRSQESLQKLGFTVDLIAYAKENIDGVQNKMKDTRNKMTSIWDEINRPEEETAEMKEAEAATQEAGEIQDCNNATFERRAIATARHLTLQMKHGFAAVSSTLTVLPTTLQTKVTDAKTYSEELYSSFANAGSLRDISSSVLTQTKDRVTHLQDTMNYFADYLKNTYFLNWLGKSSSSTNGTTEMEMEEIQGEEQPQREQPQSDDKPATSTSEAQADNI